MLWGCYHENNCRFKWYRSVVISGDWKIGFDSFAFTVYNRCFDILCQASQFLYKVQTRCLLPFLIFSLVNINFIFILLLKISSLYGLCIFPHLGILPTQTLAFSCTMNGTCWLLLYISITFFFLLFTLPYRSGSFKRNKFALPT